MGSVTYLLPGEFLSPDDKSLGMRLAMKFTVFFKERKMYKKKSFKAKCIYLSFIWKAKKFRTVVFHVKHSCMPGISIAQCSRMIITALAIKVALPLS